MNKSFNQQNELTRIMFVWRHTDSPLYKSPVKRKKGQNPLFSCIIIKWIK